MVKNATSLKNSACRWTAVPRGMKMGACQSACMLAASWCWEPAGKTELVAYRHNKLSPHPDGSTRGKSSNP